MKRQTLRIPILLLIILLVALLTLSVLAIIDPIIFWGLAGFSAVFAFLILPRIKE